MKHTLVIGGTRGIGRAVVRAFAREGHTITAIGRRPPANRKKSSIRYCAADLQDGEQVRDALQSIRSLRNLVFCQRFRGEGDAWQGELQTSLTATKEIIEGCANRGLRSVVVIASIAGRWVASEQGPGDHAAKAALIQLGRYYALTLGPQGIRVNCVSPGTTVKDENRAFYRSHPQLRNAYARITPLRRMGTAEDVANLVVFLCSEKAAFITGQNVIVDGGVSLQWPESLVRKARS